MYVTGNVKAVMLDRGFFFVRVGAVGDVWCHSRDLRGLEFDDTLEQRTVELEVEQQPRGLRGRNIRPIG
jgi:cold shock CspA family protein